MTNGRWTDEQLDAMPDKQQADQEAEQARRRMLRVPLAELHTGGNVDPWAVCYCGMAGCTDPACTARLAGIGL
jgi:hypothetical protein